MIIIDRIIDNIKYEYTNYNYNCFPTSIAYQKTDSYRYRCANADNSRRQREVSLSTLFFPPIPNDHYFKLERATSFPPAATNATGFFVKCSLVSLSLRLCVCVCV